MRSLPQVNRRRPVFVEYTLIAGVNDSVEDARRLAPLLRGIRLDKEESQRALDDLLRNIEIMLACELVHGDLSSYNVLWWQGQLKIIDLPQARSDSSGPRRDGARAPPLTARVGPTAPARSGSSRPPRRGACGGPA